MSQQSQRKGRRSRIETKQPLTARKEVYAPRRRTSPNADLAVPPPRTRSKAVVRHAKRKRVNWWVIEKRLWGLLGITFMLSVWLSPVTQPQTLAFQGVPEGARSQVESKIKAAWRTPFSLKMGYQGISNQVSQFPWVESCQTRNSGVRELLSLVKPRVPIAKTRVDNRTLWLDSAGVPFVAPQPLHLTPVSSIQISFPADLKEGQTIRLKSLKNALNVLQLLHAYELPRQVVLTINQNHDINLFLREPINQQRLRVQLGDARNAAAQIEVLASLFQHPEMIQNSEYINLLSPDAPALKYKEAERKEK